MINLVVENLPQYVGPGDIVGAFTNEVQMDGNKIGKIDFINGTALVEVKEGIADKVVEVMDQNQVAGIEVKVYIDDDIRQKIDKINDYVTEFEQLVQMEREAEMKKHELEMKNLSGYEREEKGRAILHLRGRDQGEAFGGKKVVKFMRQRRGEELPDSEISVGDLVMLSKNQPLRDDNPTGTVAEKTKYSITVVFDENPPGFIFGKGLRADLYVNDITFQRMLDAITEVEEAEGRLAELRDKFLGLEDIEFAEQDSDVEFKNQNLNQSQKQAVRQAMAAEDFFLVHGPPGTGKTMTSIEIIRQEIGPDKNILATADSNTAVDNLVERLVRDDVEVVRVGHPVRVTPVLREHTLDYLIEDHPKYQESLKLRQEADELLDKQDDLTHPSGRWRRGMSNQQIREQAQQGSGARGVPLDKIKEMAEWLELQEEIDDLFAEMDQLEEEAVNDLLSTADVVCTTNSTAGSEVLDNFWADLLVVDEATQATEPAVLIPLTKTDRVVLAGDHKQLPPTILSERAKQQGLNYTLFERLIDMYGAKIRQMLRVQYRMNDLIMNFSNREFYNGLLESADGIGGHTLADLDVSAPNGSRPAEKALVFDQPIAFFDTQGMNAPERSKSDSTSVENPIEADLVIEIAEVAKQLDFAEEDIAVIAPYKDQVELIDDKLDLQGVEVNTVDGFQGREKEVIILSFVRSNEYGNIGFLRDLRRLNVSLTRAKRKLIMIGDASTITSNEVYERLIEYVTDEGYYYAL
ncbi:IGHMBP2 family helicase [Acetohalobium arabaticum]|uniref:DNA helicase n=1 Tax=Acetohalobium arabaticum (strain ATCC 49924 / DSM 5501 / Z-7288) TaxID=574087 RepID=D9QT88_ACEAZ|nr:IGHMBP2 family helicase [Acetohalobium arabaticum]ADL13588.1 DNA helicase [Acetohalobium arabaticum DSM 5501]